MKSTKYLIIFAFILFSAKVQSADIQVNKIQADEEHSINKIELKAEPIPIPNITNQVFNRKIQIIEPNNIIQKKAVKATLSSEITLFNKEYLSYEINTDDLSIKLNQNKVIISDQAKEALKLAPNWLKAQLQIKFQLLYEKGLDDDFAQLIIKADNKYKDEVAFVIAYSSINTLTNNRFRKDIDVIIKNAELIYNIADSLQYVKLVEHGSIANNDYYTTTTYRIYDPETKDTIWNEIPKDIYYFYVVHFKMDQEGVFVADDATATEQRTYGYFWRDYIWNNPDATQNYMPVNIKTTKGEVTSIPRFGEIMKKPRILWNRTMTYLPYGREFKDNDFALDVIGNWGSRALPINVTLPRSFQPNQILMKHDGMCNEDAFLIAAACRTALIPIIYLGTWAEDHVFGSIWDNDWYHFEFFRGGLEPNGNSAYGITNMMAGGSYGWENSMVNGFRPDGYNVNFSNYYAKTSTFNVAVTDSIGTPMPGAKLHIYARNGTSILYSGTIFTDSDGKASFDVGENKFYYIQAVHPVYKTAPIEDTKVYLLNQTITKANNTYNYNLPYPNVIIDNNQVEDLNDTDNDETYKYGLNIKLKSINILTDLIEKHDSQRSRFYYWNPESKGEITSFLVDEDNYNKFKSGENYKAYYYNEYKNENEFNIKLPYKAKWYLVLSNKKYDNFYQHLTSEVSILDDFVTVEVNNNKLISQDNFGNILLNQEEINKLGIIRFEIIDTRGKLILNDEISSNLINISNLAEGAYFINLISDKSVHSAKFMK